MAKTNDYIQLAMCRSSRDKESCAIDIPIKKLLEAIDRGVPVMINHHLVEDDVYLGSREFRFNAERLLEKFKEAAIMPKGGSRTKNLHLKCSTGEIYRTKSLIERIAKPTNRKKIIKYNGAQALAYAVEAEKKYAVDLVDQRNLNAAALKDKLRQLSKNYLVRLIARTAIWATWDDYLECPNKDGIKHPNWRRRKNSERGQNTTIDENTGKMIHLDDNKLIIKMMKEMASYRYEIIYDQYHACHIWAGTCYDSQCFSNFANVVLLPNSLASLSDYNKNVIKALKWKSYTLFKSWHPHTEVQPDRYTDSLPWLELPKKNRT